jgi:hypothetical protein
MCQTSNPIKRGGGEETEVGLTGVTDGWYTTPFSPPCQRWWWAAETETAETKVLLQ